MRAFVVLALAVAACGGGERSSSLPSSGRAQPGGWFDEPVECEGVIELVCAAGMVDGCLDDRTIVHACVPTDAAPGPPCEQEIALVCPDGLIDACLLAPAAAPPPNCVAK